jgi:hypothetical protein
MFFFSTLNCFLSFFKNNPFGVLRQPLVPGSRPPQLPEKTNKSVPFRRHVSMRADFIGSLFLSAEAVTFCLFAAGAVFVRVLSADGKSGGQRILPSFTIIA